MNFAALNWVSLFFMHFISHIMKRFLKAWSTVQNSNDFLKLISDLDNNRICSWKMMIFTFFSSWSLGTKCIHFLACFCLYTCPKKCGQSLMLVGQKIFSPSTCCRFQTVHSEHKKLSYFIHIMITKTKLAFFVENKCFNVKLIRKKVIKWHKMNELHFAMKKVDQVK